MKKCCLLVRVSTQIQDYQRQINELTDHANNCNMEVVKIFANKISGGKRNEERPEILELIEYVKNNSVDLVMCHEISRLGRCTVEALKVIQLLTDHKVPLFVKNYNLTTLDEKGNINPMAQLMITIMLELGNLERNAIRQRMASGYQNYINNGGIVGRKVGYKKSDEEMKTQYVEEIKLLRKGYSLRNITKITGTSVNTLRKVKSIAV